MEETWRILQQQVGGVSSGPSRTCIRPSWRKLRTATRRPCIPSDPHMTTMGAFCPHQISSRHALDHACLPSNSMGQIVHSTIQGIK